MWSKDKKHLEARLASSLEKKIEYIMEAGRKTTWGATYKIEIRYMGKPIIKFGEGLDYMVSYYECIERNKLTEIKWTREETHQLFLKVQHKLWEEKTYTSSMFFIGMAEYLSLSIADALKHEQWMIRLFALIDKRCGKRTLIKLAKEINTYPEALREIYLIRLSNEKIPYGKNEKGEIYVRDKSEHMNPDRKRRDSGFDDYDEEFFYYENIRLNESGLTLLYEWDGANGKNELGVPRVKISKINSPIIMVTIDEAPEVIGEIPAQIGKKDIEEVKAYVSRNRERLIKIRNTPLDQTDECSEIVSALSGKAKTNNEQASERSQTP